MIVGAPEIDYEGDNVLLTSEITVQGAGEDLPQRLWFSFPRHYEQYLTSRSDPFVVALLPLAMAAGQNLEVQGEVSSRLAHGMREYRGAYNSYRPDLFQVVDVEIKNAADRSEKASNGAVGCAFSGGVDSFYTLWSHSGANEPQPEYRITHGLFVHGFDIRLEDNENFETTYGAYQQMFAEMGIDLIRSGTNVRQFCDKYLMWAFAFNAPLVAVGLCLQGLLAKYYVSSSLTYRQMRLEGSTPLFLDSLLSRDGTEVLHYGAATSRSQKIAVLSGWPVTYTKLRVCWENASGLENCCRCTKCIRTMLALEICGSLDRYSTFPKGLSRKLVRRLDLEFVPDRISARELTEEAKKAGRNDLAFDIRYALWRSRISPIVRLLCKFCKRAMRRVSRAVRSRSGRR